ncbi:MAG: hypothetical protein A2X48_17665 [Lentisphaerae bacterium GWF2_49_21]|nr:MAG: hypothetical protein A2X48_17665 [Lentisphaerae bacterium GWF2_49_21]
MHFHKLFLMAFVFAVNFWFSQDCIAADPKAPTPETLTDDCYVKVSTAAQPDASYAFTEAGDALQVVIRIAGATGAVSKPNIQLAFSNGKLLRLQSAQARYFEKNKLHHYVFTIPGKSAYMEKLNMSFSAEWAGGPYGKALRLEHYMVDDTSATHDPLPENKMSWQLVDFKEYRQKIEDARNVIRFEYEQPFEGKSTVVINDSNGDRIRNLISGEKTKAGKMSAEWDGLDDNQNLVKSGKYTWKVVSHQGITPKYLMRYADGKNDKWRSFGSNHGHFVQAVADKDYVYLASPITEGGWALIAVDGEGNWIKGFDEIHGTGYNGVAVAVDNKYFYVAHEGPLPDQDTKIKKGSKENPEFEYGINITRYNLAEQRPVPYGRESFKWLNSYERLKKEKKQGLQGMVLLDGLLYISSYYSKGILVIDPEKAEQKGLIPVNEPGTMALSGKKILIQSGDNICSIDPKTQENTVVLKNISARGMYLDEAQGLLYVSNSATNTVDVFKGADKVKSIGVPGGAYQGKFVPERMVNPAGLVVFKGKLWVTENRVNPKRVLSWDLKSDKVAVRLFGNPPYGGSAAGFDHADIGSFVGLQGLWKVDLAAKTAEFTSVFQKDAKHFGGYNWAYRYSFHHEAGRNFLVGAGFINTVSEIMPDGSLKDLAAQSTVGSFRYGCNWNPPENFEKVLEKHLKIVDPEGKNAKNFTTNLGVFWRDRNGDGLCQEDEFEFTGKEALLAGTRWGHMIDGITYRIPATIGGKDGFIVMKPDGFDKNGVPNYPTMEQAIAKAVTVSKTESLGQFASIRAESQTDRFGNLILNSTPNMVAFSPEGKKLWFFKNNWVGVHGSHNAPLPVNGQMQGNLFFLGAAGIDDKTDVFMLNGNHGRFFILTNDGFYLDEMFRDVRMGGARDDMLIGGEAFGGFFGKSDKDGKYYLITGSSGYRIYQIEGLDKIKRSSGEITVTQEQLISCDRKFKARRSEKADDVVGIALRMDKKPVIDGKDGEWPKTNSLKWDAGVFKPDARICWDSENLYLYYKVKDESPWVNTGKDWQSLFKTGDSVDLQIGTDAAADQRRKGPVPGDIRLLIAPNGEANIAVLYRHRLKNGDKGSPVKFTSPWRSETVDDVRRIENAKIAVQRSESEYMVEVSIPLAELGLKPGPENYIADVGVIFGDDEGTINLLRSYWSNKATGLVNDVPGEIMLSPDMWGKIKFEGEK